MRMFKVRYRAWEDGARLPVHGEFHIAGTSIEDVRRACALRWPSMFEIKVTEIS